MNIIDLLNWRYATKSMTGQKVPREKLDRIIEAARLAPTSSGLQPFEVIAISNPELKEKIKGVAYNQSPITQCSHLLVFAAWDHYTPERINHMFDLTNEVRGMKNEGWENYRKMLLEQYPKRSPEENYQHAAKQAYIGFAMAILAAAAEQVDATPMEGFDAKALDDLLGLKAKSLRSVVLLPLGYRDAEKDWAVSLKKVRRPLKTFLTTLD